MSSLPDPSKASWRLKLDRAEHHLKEFESEVLLYANRHPYNATRIGRRNEDGGDWRYALRITEQPDPMLAVIAGDIVHNLRSGLNHLAVALAPKSRRYEAKFPIIMVDDDEGRERFSKATPEMAAEAVTIIQELQPYAAGEDYKLFHPLWVISKLNNRDKHRERIIFASGLEHFVTTVTLMSYPALRPLEQKPRLTPEGFPYFCEDGAEVANFDLPVGIKKRQRPM